MNKAFTKESDTEAEDETDVADTLPPEVKNYMTPAGHAAMQKEHYQLLVVERPSVVETVSWAAGNGDRSENGDYIYGKKRLREIDRRLRYLSMRLESAVVVDPRQQQQLQQVFFGARVTYAREGGEEQVVSLVGIDETDASRGRISWLSPVAKGLMKARAGDRVRVQVPGGSESLEVRKVEYPLGD